MTNHCTRLFKTFLFSFRSMLMLKNELETDPSFHVTTRDQDQYTSKRLYFKDKSAVSARKVFESGETEVKVEQSGSNNLRNYALRSNDFVLINARRNRKQKVVRHLMTYQSNFKIRNSLL